MTFDGYSDRKLDADEAGARAAPGRWEVLAGRAIRSPVLWAAALAMLAVAIAPPGAQLTVMRIAALAFGIVAAWRLARASGPITRSTREQFGARLETQSPAGTDIPSLRAVDHALRMATARAFGVEFMLKPLLLDLARGRLMRQRNIDIDATPELARQAMGEALWLLTRPAPEPLAEYGAPGVALTQIDAAVRALEEI